MKESAYNLHGRFPDGSNVCFPLLGTRMVLGRRGDLVLMHDSVSRQHALLEWRDDGWLLSDLGSRNGTMVNGVSIQRKMLADGDRLKFGKIELTLDAGISSEDGDDETRIVTMTQMSGVLGGVDTKSLVGRSEALKAAMKLAVRAARSDATVLLVGESGTGKELFARLVYEESLRRGRKFVPVHSGAIESSLLGSTLFGHEKGAFTGAVTQKKGLFEEADGGTIFLDEIGEINAETQVKLLRVLQEGEFMRVGGTEPIKVNVRVICATNRDLVAAVKAGTFREDLYYRLNVIQIQLPPLRERVGDVRDLINHYVARLGGPFRKVAPDAMEVLCSYRWPGNVRELRNIVERMVVLAEGDTITVADLPPEVATMSMKTVDNEGERDIDVEQPVETSNLAEIELRHVKTVLEQCGGNKKAAAERLGISRSTLYEKLRGGQT